MRSTAVLLGSLFVISGVILAACAGTPSDPTTGGSAASASTPAPASAPGTDSVVVEMRGFKFDPPAVTVHAGQTVLWRNDDGEPHTATSGSCSNSTCTAAPGFDSGTLKQGETFSHTFNSAGTFTYYCQVHGSSMQGTITVTP